MTTATFRFYEELNDFLPALRRKTDFSCRCAEAATTKHMIEALGVPHTEVELILVNGESVGFERRIDDGDRIAVYPRFEALDITPLLRVRERPLREVKMIADAHLGGLARLLRMAGFDTLYDNNYADRAIVDRALADRRIVLTRDRELLKVKRLTHGCYVHALKPELQLHEIMQRLDLVQHLHPFSRCLKCNVLLRPVAKAEIIDRLPASVSARHQHFTTCDGCGRLYWRGSHWERMQRLLHAE